MTDRADYTDPARPGIPRRMAQDAYGSDVKATAVGDADSGSTAKDPDQIRREIERTRSELGSNVDALADKVTPSKIMQRQTGKVRDALGSVSERVMGSASDTSGRVSDAASDAASGVAGLPHTAVEKAKGNPLAVGLIAFGAGWLVASLMPASAPEQRMASQLKDAASPLVDEAVEAAKSMGESLKEPAQNAATAVKDAATEAVDTVKGEATDATGTVKEEARRSAGTTQL